MINNRLLKLKQVIQPNHTRASTRTMATLQSIKKTCIFTENLPPDPEILTPQAAEDNPSATHTPRIVRGALFTYVKPATNTTYEVIATSKSCMELLGLDPKEAQTEEFKQLVSGNKTYEGVYPWAQCYGGYQFGVWASQLGDGRAISLAEFQADQNSERYEIQLKGAGKTPYSRFADGNAVLRSSIREFLISEHLAALGIPTTRALALTLLPQRKALRERIEPCAIVTRVAQSWIRVGTFDLLRRRGDRKNLKILADYCIEHVFGGEAKLKESIGHQLGSGNRYEALYREVVKRSASLVGKLQAYGFMNGVLNTDNTSIFGLSMDYGPFAFCDTFDPAYTPNHDDGQLRYSYRLQPTIFWWNMTRLGEALGELFGAGEKVDELWARSDFLDGTIPEAEVDPILTKAESIIGEVGTAYKEEFMASYKKEIGPRLGYTIETEADLNLVHEAMTLMETYELDFHNFFYRLSEENFSGTSIVGEAKGNFGGAGKEGAIEGIDKFLESYRALLAEKNVKIDAARTKQMKAANPKFVLRSWILDEVLQKVEKNQDYELLNAVLDKAVRPFDEHDDELGRKYCGEVPSGTGAGANAQCSCSS